MPKPEWMKRRKKRPKTARARIRLQRKADDRRSKPPPRRDVTTYKVNFDFAKTLRAEVWDSRSPARVRGRPNSAPAAWAGGRGLRGGGKKERPVAAGMLKPRRRITELRKDGVLKMTPGMLQRAGDRQRVDLGTYKDGRERKHSVFRDKRHDRAFPGQDVRGSEPIKKFQPRR